MVQAHNAKEVRPRREGDQLWIQRGSVLGNKGAVPKIQGDGSTTKPNGIMNVAILDFDLAWVLYPIMLCWF
jgi:hypothetical protein